jgi:hypothetical protein
MLRALRFFWKQEARSKRQEARSKYLEARGKRLDEGCNITIRSSGRNAPLLLLAFLCKRTGAVRDAAVV